MILKCISCKKEFTPKKGLYTCPDCGMLRGTLEIIYDYESIHLEKNFNKRAGLFQFKDLLPVASHTILDTYIGGTPLIKLDAFGFKDLLIKYDGLSFSGSYKDRASIIAINHAIENDYDTIFCASTGNAASSLALLNAHTHLKTKIFVPNRIPIGKLAQLVAAGADIYKVEASYDQVFDASLDIGLKKGWYSRHSAINPYLLEGKKTGAFEIVVQNDYKAPDYVFVGVGDGTVISSLLKGFHEFHHLGMIHKMPCVVGVQAEGASTLYKAFHEDRLLVEEADTIADSIAVGNPRDIVKACVYLKMYKGQMMTVTDDEIRKAITLLASHTGVFSEPAGAVTLAGALKMKAKGSVCLVITGNGLKDIQAVEIDQIKTYSLDTIKNMEAKK